MHDYLYRQMFGEDASFDDGVTCCGGFAVREGDTCYSSQWLNMQTGHCGRRRWFSDKQKYLPLQETILVDHAVKECIEQGPGAVWYTSNRSHKRLSGR